jgi:hypothetical protein
MIDRILQSKLFERYTVPLRRRLTAHTARVADQRIRKMRDEVREQLMGELNRLMGDVDALNKRTSLQATNLAASVKYIESLTADVHKLEDLVGDTREQLILARARLDDIAAQLMEATDRASRVSHAPGFDPSANGP